jgi:gamma-glutamyltranspeptidase / glutathione hydrolase
MRGETEGAEASGEDSQGLCENCMLRRLVLAALLVGILSACGAQPTASVSSSRGNGAGEGTTSSEEGLVGGEATESADQQPRNASISENTSTSPALGTSGMISSANPLATQAGLDTLQEGGNAFDAAVAVAAALNVVEPMMSGIGGYGAIVIYDARKGETRFLDPGTKFPATLDPNVFRSTMPNYKENRCGARSVVTPSSVSTWETLSKNYGSLQWQRLFDPAIELANKGFAIDDITAGWIGAAWLQFPKNAKNIYGNDGVPLRGGEYLVQKDLARSLGLIADQGAQALYSSELGQAIDSAMKENGGFLTLDDLRNGRAQWRDTTSIAYRGYEVVTSSPPATSWNELLRLGIMSQFGLKASDQNSVSYLHTFTEATKEASLAARGYAADPDIQSTPLNQLLSKGYWAEQAAKINPSWASPSPAPTTGLTTLSGCGPTTYTPTSALGTQGGHTTHFVVADKEGNVVSATQTLGDVFGSKVMPQGTGIWLNDFTAWSRFEPAGNSFDAFPDRNVLYDLCPTLVMSNGRPWIAIGTPGGHTIPQTTPQMLMNVIDFGMDIQQAIASPRVSFVSGHLVVEAGIPQPVRAGLSALGQDVQVDETDPRGLGNAHGLTIEYNSEGKPSRFTGGSDPRGEGVAAGY